MGFGSKRFNPKRSCSSICDNKVRGALHRDGNDGDAGGIKKARRGDVATAIGILRQRFGERLQTGEAIRRQHGHTLTWLPNQLPMPSSGWSRPRRCGRSCGWPATHRVPLIPFGAGTSLEGHLNAPEGGLSLDVSRMDGILAVNARDLDCVVQPGVSREQLNDYLRDQGLFFPVDPGAEEATIGGMAATRASGTTAARYGTMRENVLTFTAVMADGSVIRTARRARKSSAGYDLTRLLVGSEGTLGIITELTVRLFGIPERIVAAARPFHDPRGGGQCRHPIDPARPRRCPHRARRRFADPAINKHAKLALAENPTLFLEFHGTEVPAGDQVERFQADRRVRGRSRLRLGRARGGPPTALEGAPRGLLGGQDRLAGPRGPSPPTSAFRSRAWPSASWRRRPTSRRWA